MLDEKEIERERVMLQAGLCPEGDGFNLARVNDCAVCHHFNALDAVFCGGCGKPVKVHAMSKEMRLKHAESHWGVDFDKKTEVKVEIPEGMSEDDVTSEWLFEHAGVFHHEGHFPDAVRRWHAVVEFKAVDEDAQIMAAEKMAQSAPTKVITVGAKASTKVGIDSSPHKAPVEEAKK